MSRSESTYKTQIENGKTHKNAENEMRKNKNIEKIMGTTNIRTKNRLALGDSKFFDIAIHNIRLFVGSMMSAKDIVCAFFIAKTHQSNQRTVPDHAKVSDGLSNLHLVSKTCYLLLNIVLMFAGILNISAKSMTQRSSLF